MLLLVDEKTLVHETLKIFGEAEMMGTIPVRHSLPELQRRADKLLTRMQSLAESPSALSEQEIDESYDRMVNMLDEKYGDRIE